MSKRHPNPQLAKINRTYTVAEVANLFGVHRNTVRQWLKHGLPMIDKRRPTLIHGRDLVDYLRGRRAKNKRPCQPGEIYCVRCRAPRTPAGDMADYQPKTDSVGQLVAICPVCDALMYRCVSLAKLDHVCGKMDVRMPQAHPHIVESIKPSVNHDFG